MHIRRLTVAHWRGLNFELSELSPGLNLVFGPNEAGKSRLVEALRFALFESSSGRSAHKKALATWGAGAGKPRVAVEFELAGTLWKLEKEFLGTGHSTVLRSDAVSLDGADAEARLAELMGVGPGGRLETKPEDRGIWSLLWVDQGGSRDAPQHNESSQTRIHDRLSQEIGEVAAGPLGQRVLAAAEEQKNRFFTANRDAYKTTLTEPREAVADLRRRLEEAVARRDQVAADADELDRQRSAEQDLIRRLHTAEQRRETTRATQQAADDLGRRLELCDEQVRTAESECERCRNALASVRSVAAQTEHLSRQLLEAEADARTAESNRQSAQAAADDARRHAADADACHAEQQRLLQTLRGRREREALRAQSRQLCRQLEEAAEVGRQAAALQEELGRLPRVSAEDVAGLRQARDTRDTARARLEGASASVELEARRDLKVSGRDLPAGAVRRELVEDEQRLEIEGIVAITVRPGGGDLARLRDAANDAARELDRLLASLAVADVADAARVAERRRELQVELDRCRADLQRHLPQGRESAEAALRELDGRLNGAAVPARRQGEPAGEGADEPADEPFCERALAQAEQRQQELALRREELRAVRDVAADRLGAAREDAADRHARLESLRRQQGELNARRAELADSAALAARLAEMERLWKERLAVRDDLEEKFEALGGEDIELDLEQAELACRHLARELETVRLRCAALQASVAAAGDDGRHERVQEIEAELLAAETTLARLERQAAAARRLYQVLKEEYDGARERLAEPVIRRIRPYLQALFPGTEVWLDEELGLKGLRADDADQSFEALSGGAREQLSLLVRIGLAEVAGADEPWPLVLDDVLVNTDAERIQRVQRVLFQASRNMQILLFTCHGPMFDGLGADRRIELPQGRPGRPQSHGQP